MNQNGGDRPLSLIFLYGLDQVTNSNLFFTIEYVAVILGPALVLTIYFLTREITSNDITSLIAAFITAVSFHMLIGIYAGFYANWLALILGYLSFLFFIRFLKKGGSENLLLYGILATAMLFTHVYTWSVLSIVAGLFLLIMILRPRSLSNTGRRNAILLMLVLLLTVVMDVSRATATGASGGVERDLEWANVFIDPENYLLRWNNLSYTTTTFVGGIFANFIIFGLCLYWLGTTKMQSTGAIFLMIFFSIGILPFLIGEWVIQTRVFYNVPFQIPAAIAVTYIMQRPSKKLLKLIMLFIWLVAIATVSVSNFYLVTPRAAT